jgi:hypothetical protein
MYETYFPTEMVTKVKPNINSVEVNSVYLFISINQEVQWWTSPPPESSPRRLFNHPSYHYYSFSEGRWPTGRIFGLAENVECHNQRGAGGAVGTVLTRGGRTTN